MTARIFVALFALCCMGSAGLECGPLECETDHPSQPARVDTLFVPPDTVIVPPDTVIVPPDTVWVPPDTITVVIQLPPDTVYVVVEPDCGDACIEGVRSGAIKGWGQFRKCLEGCDD